jgi:hypothetical protein
MIRYIAKNYKGTKKFNKKVNRPPTMHVCHCIDQHWAPELIYFFPYEEVCSGKTKGSKPYKDMFLRIFREVTGVNPRKNANFDSVKFENSKFVKHTRFAQKLVLKAKQIIPVARKPDPEKESEKLSYSLDKSWIAGMIGAVEVPGRPVILTTLRPEDPEQIVAIKKPSRDMKNAVLSPEQEEGAIEATRKMLMEGLPLNKTKPPVPVLRGAKLILREVEEEESEEEGGRIEDEEEEEGKEEEEDEDEEEEDEEDDGEEGRREKKKSKKPVKKGKGKTQQQPKKQRNGKKQEQKKSRVVAREYLIKTKEKGGSLLNWEDVREDTLEISYLESQNGNIFHTALTTFGDGIQKNGWTKLREKLKKYDPTVIRRALMYISGFKQSFEMGRVSREGGGTKGAVIVEDVGAFQLLIWVSVLFPSALRRQKGSSTSFEVPLGPLLWKVREQMALHLAEDVDYESAKWDKVEDKLERTPWQHQLDALEEMKEAHGRGRKGHFIWIPVGMGKTWIVLSYLKFLKSANKLPKYVERGGGGGEGWRRIGKGREGREGKGGMEGWRGRGEGGEKEKG